MIPGFRWEFWALASFSWNTPLLSQIQLRWLWLLRGLRLSSEASFCGAFPLRSFVRVQRDFYGAPNAARFDSDTEIACKRDSRLGCVTGFPCRKS